MEVRDAVEADDGRLSLVLSYPSPGGGNVVVTRGDGVSRNKNMDDDELDVPIPIPRGGGENDGDENDGEEEKAFDPSKSSIGGLLIESGEVRLWSI